MTSFKYIKVFTDRYPLLGPSIWILSIEYFMAQLIVGGAWKIPYSWRFNTISDLGNTVCGLQTHRFVCSPLHDLMNSAFIMLGLIMSLGSLLIYQEFRQNRATIIGFTLMGIGGIGTIMVGLFPENTISILHLIGAALPFTLGNLSLIILSFALNRVPHIIKVYAFVSGAVSLIALGALLSHHYGLLGPGGVERLVSYPQVTWLFLFGIYMTKSHYSQQNLKKDIY